MTASFERKRSDWSEVRFSDAPFSAGCKNCYAERLVLRLQVMDNPRYRNGFRVMLHPDLLDSPKRWREPRLIFVNSMSDWGVFLVALDFGCPIELCEAR